MKVQIGARFGAIAGLAMMSAGAWAQTPNTTPAPTPQVAQPGQRVNVQELATKKDLERLATKEDLKQLARKEDVDALKVDLTRMLTQIREIRARLAAPAQPIPASQVVPQATPSRP